MISIYLLTQLQTFWSVSVKAGSWIRCTDTVYSWIVLRGFFLPQLSHCLEHQVNPHFNSPDQPESSSALPEHYNKTETDRFFLHTWHSLAQIVPTLQFCTVILLIFFYNHSCIQVKRLLTHRMHELLLILYVCHHNCKNTPIVLQWLVNQPD